MTLDLLALSTQARAMSSALRDDLRTLPQRIAAAHAMLRAEAHEWEYWRDLIDEQQRAAAWLTAQPLEPLDQIHDLPPCPAAYTVAASDGSQMDVDHHGTVACYVINVGTAVLQYGSNAYYQAVSEPELGFRDDHLIIRDPLTGREYAKQGAVLAAQRDIAEGLRLAALAMQLGDDRPRAALQDGTLIRWTLNDFDPFLKNHFLGDYLSYLDTMRALNCPVASYLSRPRAREVIGLLKLVLVKGDYGRWQADVPDRSADPLRGLLDTLLFADLRDGQRSARFASTSRINVEFYGPHRVQFFYLRVGRELARVEFPAWVADANHLDLIHALVYDQCQRGHGYPNILARAHEQAVIHAAERQQFQRLIDRLLAQADLPTQRSAKADAKLRPQV